MGLESATYISDLDVSNPVHATDGAGVGDDHLRLIKSTLKATFPSVTGAVTPTHTELNYVDGVTSAIQTQLDTKQTHNVVIGTAGGGQTIAAARVTIYCGQADAESWTGATLPASPTNGDIIFLVTPAYTSGSPTINRNGNLINGAASNYTPSASALYVLVYSLGNWGINP